MKIPATLRRHKIFGGSVLILLVLVSLLVGKQMMRAGVDTSNPPKFIQADFVDLSKIYSVSKFRSLAGHDFSGGGEACRSMKHYFAPQLDKAAQTYMMEHNFTPPKPDGKTDIPIYSPVDGKVVKIASENNATGNQIYIVPDNAKDYTIRLFHIWPRAGLKAGLLFGIGGSHVKAGEQIGVIGAYQETDIAIQAKDKIKGSTYVSYFDVMPDKLFDSYIARGVVARDDLIISKEKRDANAVTCQSRSQGERFNKPPGFDENADYVRLSGYIKVNSDGSIVGGSANPQHN